MVNVDQINANYTYRYDRDQYGKPDRWKIMEGPQYVGDCEDYSLTVLWHIAGQSWFKFWLLQVIGVASIRLCHLPGGAHIVLRYKGHYIDNIQQEWSDIGTLRGKGYEFKWTVPVLYTAISMWMKR